jgi:predicted DNA-binding ribbon-helix-helix protein
MREPLDDLDGKPKDFNEESRRFSLSDAVTEVSLPGAIWAALTDIARNEGLPLVSLMGKVAKEKGVRPLEEALWVLALLWQKSKRGGPRK